MFRALQLWIVAIVLVGSMVPESSFAQEKPEYLLTHKETKENPKAPCACKEEKEEEEEEDPSNWEFKLQFGSIFALSQNNNVVGVQNGGTRSIGGEVHFEANWARNRHEVYNRADVTALFIKTPNTGGWVTASDLLELETTYQFRAKKYIGPFVRAGFATSMFVGRDLRTNSVDYELEDGTLLEDRTRLRLTDPFKPITLQQTVGVFFNPIREEGYNLDIRTGLGAREVFADGQRGLDDDNATPSIVETTDLEDYVQAGWEVIVALRGELFEKKVSYYLTGEFLLPFYRSNKNGDDRNAVELMTKTVRFGLAYRIAKWATLLYEIRLVHEPQLIDKYQIQNSVGFKASYSVY